jgi:hypothetical protein
LFAITLPAADTTPPLRVAIAGLVHGHADGFFSHSLNRPEIQIVAIAEPDRSLFDRYAAKFHFDPSLYHADLEETLRTSKPQAVLVYTSTYDHRKVVELCARYSVPVMMEKPLAVSDQDAQAIARAARTAKIQVLVNYETPGTAATMLLTNWYSPAPSAKFAKLLFTTATKGPRRSMSSPNSLSGSLIQNLTARALSSILAAMAPTS